MQNKNTAAVTYTCIGSVRGACPHKHRTLCGAVRCLAHDQRGCASQGGYSDRFVVPSDLAADTQALADDVADRLYRGK